MTETECQFFFKEELRLLENLAENSRRQMGKLEKRLWSGLRRLSAERDDYLRTWQNRKDQRTEAWETLGGSLQALRAEVRAKQTEVERLHAVLIQETQCAKQAQALKLQRLNKGQVATNRYEGPAPTSIRWNIQG